LKKRKKVRSGKGENLLDPQIGKQNTWGTTGRRAKKVRRTRVTLDYGMQIARPGIKKIREGKQKWEVVPPHNDNATCNTNKTPIGSWGNAL